MVLVAAERYFNICKPFHTNLVIYDLAFLTLFFFLKIPWHDNSIESYKKLLFSFCEIFCTFHIKGFVLVSFRGDMKWKLSNNSSLTKIDAACFWQRLLEDFFPPLDHLTKCFFRPNLTGFSSFLSLLLRILGVRARHKNGWKI